MKKQAFDLKQKKSPKQGRSQMTFDAIIIGATQVLISRGYHGLTTNHVADVAGVSIGSLYEYFPGKDAVVAAVADRFISDILLNAIATLNHAHTLPMEDGVRWAVNAFYQKLVQEKELLRVLFFQVPFIGELESFTNLGPMSLQVMMAANQRSGPEYRRFSSMASIYLLNTLIASTLLQIALMPLPGIAVEDIQEELAQKIIDWTAAQ